MLSFGFRIFCWYRGFCHRTGSDLLLFLILDIVIWAYFDAYSKDLYVV